MNNEVWAKAFSDIAKEKYDAFCRVEKEHRFSFGYRINKHKIIKQYNKQNAGRVINMGSVLKKNAILAAAVIALLATMGFAAYQVISGFIFNEHHTYSTVRFEDIENAKTEITEYYILSSEELTYLGEENLKTLRFIDYEYHGQALTFQQQPAFYANNLDTESRKAYPVDVGEYKGFMIGAESGESILVWARDGYVFTIYGNLPENDLINLANSTKIENI